LREHIVEAIIWWVHGWEAIKRPSS
jgi:hypothetical protein